MALNPRMIGDPDLDPLTNPALPDYYVIDPLGWNATQAAGMGATFGNILGAPFVKDVTTVPGFNVGGTSRWHAGRDTPAKADHLVSLPDSWVSQVELEFARFTTRAAASGPTGMVVAGGGAAAFVMTPGLTHRVVMFGADGVSSHIRTLTDVQGINLEWTEDINNNATLDPGEDTNFNGIIDDHAMPAGFVPFAIRIETQERRYTWLLTCRQSSVIGAADVEVAVFFGRNVENPTDDEALYLTQRFGAGTKVINVDYSAYPQAPAAKRGGFIFDANNARWYRITSIDDNKAGLMRVGIEVPTYAPSPAAGGRVMFPKGVVDVYPIGTKT
jgi:hypothetical protein